MTITTNILVKLTFQLEKTSEIHDIYIKESFFKNESALCYCLLIDTIKTNYRR